MDKTNLWQHFISMQFQGRSSARKCSSNSSKALCSQTRSYGETLASSTSSSCSCSRTWTSQDVDRCCQTSAINSSVSSHRPSYAIISNRFVRHGLLELLDVRWKLRVVISAGFGTRFVDKCFLDVIVYLSDVTSILRY